MDECDDICTTGKWTLKFLLHFSGPVVSAFANKFGCRKVTIFGSLLTCLALLVSTCAPSIEVLMFLYGVVGGSLSYPLSCVQHTYCTYM